MRAPNVFSARLPSRSTPSASSSHPSVVMKASRRAHSSALMPAKEGTGLSRLTRSARVSPPVSNRFAKSWWTATFHARVVGRMSSIQRSWKRETSAMASRRSSGASAMKVMRGTLPARRPVRPRRWASDDTVDGASSWKMWSRSPMSMPSSRLLVATRVASGAFSNASSAWSRASRPTEEWWTHTGTPPAWSAPASSSARERLSTNTSRFWPWPRSRMSAAAALVPWPTCQANSGRFRSAGGATTTGSVVAPLP